MKKLLVIFLIIPLFFACKHDSSSGSHEEPQAPIPACTIDDDCSGRSDGKTACHHGECVNPDLLSARACDPNNSTKILNGLGEEVGICAGNKHCSSGYCVSD